MDSNVTSTGGSKNYVIEPEKSALKIILSIICSIAAALVGYYCYLPALNPKAPELWIYLIGVVISFVLFLSIFSGATKKPEYGPYVRRKSIVPVIIVGALALIAGIGFLAGSTFLRAVPHSELLNVNVHAEEEFVKFIRPADAASFNNVPRLDEDSARQLANKALSDLGDADTVSQYTIYPMFTQINYREKPVRVVPLQYADLIKWFTNTSRGLPGYIIIDMASEETHFQRLPDGQFIRYSPAEHFGRLLKRHLRFQFPTFLFGDATFDIDNDGNPYWITPRLDNTLGLFGGTDVIGVVITKADSPTGESHYYTIDDLRDKDEFRWISRVFSSSLLIKQFNFHGKLHSGFWNSILGQREVRVATEGVNYIAMYDDVFLYSGVTSSTADQSIIGFLLINQRTKDANFYRVGGATERAAMGSAEGMVAHMQYKATFPLLVNVAGQPTYFMALKDVRNNNQIVQQFALVNVKDFNKVRATGVTVSETFRLYNAVLAENGLANNQSPGAIPDDGTEVISGTIADIRTQLIGGNSMYYINLTDSKVWYRISAAEYENVVLLSKGSKIKILVEKAVGNILSIIEFQ